ncbi:MFS transporter [Mycobacterium sp. ITM-2016-00318]|uniref:MFS transporter n=1 Tax=Mycobacterium sp. ITM-2016-00318 TaxID=2099693 RepID=UPI00287F4E31|nr:MFS transporter [Mycobacterium sp. ITM-2016-00318]WNG93624.1 MFS transporter [Mycobacterium sp. ITM-2016-00318]
MPTDAPAESRYVAGLAATMTVAAMGLGYAISIGDPTILSANLQVVSAGLQITGSTATFVASLATLTMAAAVLSAGALGDRYGMRRMYLIGLTGAVVFSALAAAAPLPAVLMVARGGVGVSLAFLIGLSLALTNAVFPPGKRAAAIAAYFGVGYAVATPLPALAGMLAHAIGWRACFFVVPVIAAIGLLITWRFVPETTPAARRLDLPGLALFAVALLGLIFGTSRMETGVDAVGLVSIGIGLAAGGAFVMQELRTADPALDMRVFRSSRFNAAVAAGVVFNIVLGGSMVLLAFYLVTIRKESHELFGLLLIPATAMAAVAATSAGPAANRFGPRTVLVGGLVVMLIGLLILRSFDLHTSRPVVFATTALLVVGGALVTTPQAQIMMSSAPDDLGGAISAVKSAVNEGGYSLGPALFALVGINLFLTDSVHDLSRSGVTRTETREALLTAHGGREAHLVNPEQARLVIDQAPQNAVDAIHTLSVIMAAGPVIAIVVALWLIKPADRS